MNRTLLVLACLVALGGCGAGGTREAAPRKLPPAPPPPAMQEEGGACAADVRQCPDGSFVSRNPAKACAFDACPGEAK